MMIFNVKVVACRDEFFEYFSVFQLVVLGEGGLSHTTFLFWFTLIALIALIVLFIGCNRQTCKNLTVCNLLST